MQLFLTPSDKKMDLKKAYEKAFSEATELYVLSAYLTAWEFQQELNQECIRFRLIVGTDFGITRKKALTDALNWLPSTQKCNFLAADDVSGFHPKAAFWKDKEGNCYCIIGSSNQTNAAFKNNYEANLLSKMTLSEFEEALEWVGGIEDNCRPVNEHWIDKYIEGKPSKNVSGKKKSSCIREPDEFAEYLPHRKKQMKAYAEIRSAYMALVEKCAAGEMSNNDFYEEFNDLWGNEHHVSFQSGVWKISGKASNFSEVCKSLIKVRDSEVSIRDDVVKDELDWLERQGNPSRKSFFTELLCKEFPDQYPVWNGPIEKYLKSCDLEFPRQSSFGSKYIHIAREMRKTAKEKNVRVKNLAELDLWIGLQKGWN